MATTLLSFFQSDTKLPTSFRKIVDQVVRVGLSLGVGLTAISLFTTVYGRFVVSPTDELDVTPKQFDIGNVAQGRFVNATVMLTNRSKRLLHITAAVPGCGCTSIKSPTVLLSNEPTPIVATYDTDGPTGAVHKSMTIVFAEFPNKPLVLKITGSVHQEIQITPANQDMDQIEGGTIQHFAFTVTRTDGNPLIITPSELPAEVHINIRNYTASVVHVSGTLTAPRLPNDYIDTLNFQTNDPALPQIKTPLSYTVRPRFIVEPRIANFGAITPDAKTKMLLMIHGDARVRLLTVPDGMEAKLWQPGSDGGSFALSVSLAGQGKERIVSGRLTLATDDPKQPQIVVPVYAVRKQ